MYGQPVVVRRVDAGGVSLAVAEADAAAQAPPGGAGQPLMLVHGFTGAKEEFSGFLDPLAAGGWHAIAPDLRGHGQSDHPDGLESYDLGTFVADLVALAEASGWEGFVLVGHSMGGAVAQRLALDYPERLRALVLMSTFHGPLPVDPSLVALGVMVVEQGGLPALAAAMAARRSDDPAAVAARQRIEAARPGATEWADTRLLACSPDMWRAMAPRFPDWPDTLGEVGRLDVPTLVVVGAEDDQMLDQCRALAAAIPGARLEVMADVRHSPQLEAPDRTLAILEAFLESL